jgi:hypothetical protein
MLQFSYLVFENTIIFDDQCRARLPTHSPTAAQSHDQRGNTGLIEPPEAYWLL